MKLAVIGTGYVGLTFGACMAEVGHDVVCADVDSKKIDDLKSGSIGIYEPGLVEIVERNATAGRLNFTADAGEAIRFAEIVLCSVGTPQDAIGKTDVTAVYAVAQAFARYARPEQVFVNRSTSPVGTARECSRIINGEFERRGISSAYDVVSNPEFLREGHAVSDCLKSDRIIVGTDSKQAAEELKKMYIPIIEKGSTFLVTSPESAELTKYASNALLATKISFMNELARISELVGADIMDIEKGIGLDSRIGRRYLHAGIGYGGSCFPKDINAMLWTSSDNKYTFEILTAVRSVNEQQKKIFMAKLREHLPQLRGLKIAVWGLSFKPKTDDMREAPSLDVIRELLAHNATVAAYDPAAAESCRKIFPDISYADSAIEAVRGADALLLLTEWDEFRSVDFLRIKSLMRGSTIGDGRNIWQPEELRELGFTYFSIGRA